MKLKALFILMALTGVQSMAQIEDLTLSHDASMGNSQASEQFVTRQRSTIAAPQVAEIWASTGSSTEVDYCALVLDYDGTSNVFVKVQSQDGFPGFFDTAAMYVRNNGAGWPGQTGGPAFFPIIPFDDGVISVEHDGAGNVTLRTPVGTYKRGGWTPLGGAQAGLGAFSSNFQMDNFRIAGGICDDFNRANGYLGPDWTSINGAIVIRDLQATGSAPFSMMVFGGNCGPACTGKEKVKSAVCKKGSLTVKTTGANPGAVVRAVIGLETLSAISNPDGSASFKFENRPTGPGTIRVTWDCAQSETVTYFCTE